MWAQIGSDGIVRDEMGFPIPKSDVAELVKQVVLRYAGMPISELEELWHQCAVDHGMAEQLEEVDLS